MVNNLVYIKVHKCSSHSVRVILENYTTKKGLKHLKPSLEKIIHLRKQKGLFHWTRSADGDNSSAFNIRNGPYNISLTHHAYDPPFFNKLIKDPIYITFLRHPLSRAISAFHNSAVPPSPKEIEKLTFEEWYKTNETFLNSKPQQNHYSSCVLKNNFMSYMLGYDSLEEITMENLVKRYSFIGLTEHFNDSIKSLSHVLGWDLGPERPHIHQTSGKPQVELSADFIATFERNNSLDYKLYDLAKKNLSRCIPR